MRRFGLIGFPLSHSFSENYFSEKFEREKITDCSYSLFPIETIDAFPDLLKSNSDLRGLNVTIPYKEKIIPFLESLDETASAIGAVNCISIDANGKTVGHNTDAHGFRQSLKPFLASHHERALILGTGGASKAVEFVLKQIGVECIFASREKKEVSGKIVLSYTEINQYVLAACKLIVNCTPVGMFPNDSLAPKIPYEDLTDSHFLYDLIYNPAETEFLKRGKAKGALTLNGYDMLKMQAEKAWEIWNS
jgi:shikimate dehydrogenase